MYYVRSTKKQSTYPFRNELKYYGFQWDKDKRMWCGECSDEGFIKSLERRGLYVMDSGFMRSTTYRKTFLKYNDPPYHCAYCGRKLTRQTLTVDHLVPVHKLSSGKHRKFYQKMLKVVCRTTDANDLNNLVCACARCNSKKRAKTGLWIVRGKLGSTNWFWPFLKFLLAAAVLCALYFLLVPEIRASVLFG